VPETELEYLRRGEVVVTRSRLIIKDTTYVLANITSVSSAHSEHVRYKTKPLPFITGSVLLVIGLAPLPAYISDEGIRGTIGAVEIGFISDLAYRIPDALLVVATVSLFILMATGAILMALSVEKHVIRRYSVRIVSAATEYDVITSSDKEGIKDIVNAINQAIVDRG
jgi:hypothetical protein